MKLEAPNIHDIDSWQGAAIASTSRLLLPVHEVEYGSDSPVRSRKFDYHQSNSLLSRLEKLVVAEVADHSEALQ